MDSITHLFYGGVIAAAIAPKQHRRAALLAGMALNTLPDLDVLPLMLSDDPVVRMTWHRSATHSWFVLPFVALALWAWFRGRGGRVAEAPARWWWAIFACLMAHPLLDSFTVYGTQLFWPLPMNPVMWASMFIVDPLFTLPWVLAFAVAWFARGKPMAQRALAAGLVLGFGYIGWSLFAKARVERAAEPALAALGLRNAPHFAVPAAANTRHWRVVAMTGDGYVEAFRSLSDSGPMRFTAHRSDVDALQAVRDFSSVRRLGWFNSGFMGAETRGGELVLSDLRMGAAPDYAFRFAVAERAASGWRPIAPVDVDRRQSARALKLLWKRLRGERSDQAAMESPGGTPATSASK